MNKANKDDVTLLHIASQQGHLEIVKVLIASGGSVNEADNDGATPLHIASQQGHLEIMKVLVAAGGSVNQAAKNGATPLFIATQNGLLEVVKLLIAAGGSVNKATSGFTPLHVASQRGHLEVVQLLLEMKAEVDPRDPKGCTPLHWACITSNFNVVKTLVKAKANFLYKSSDNMNNTPLDIAKMVEADEIKHYIINHPWYRRRPLIVMRPHADHKTNKKHRMTSLGWIVTAKEGDDPELFDLRRTVASFL